MSMGSEILDDYAFELTHPFGIPIGSDPVWKSRSGAIKVSQMTESHLRNCMHIVGEDDEWFYVFQKELERRMKPMETCCNYTGDVMFISTDERRLINRIMRFKEARPDDVEIIRLPEDNDGCLYCKVPADWLKITPPARRELTEEQKAAAVARLNGHREVKPLAQE